MKNFEVVNDFHMQVSTKIEIASIYLKQGEFHKVKECADEILSISEEHGFNEHYLYGLNLFALALLKENDLVNSKKYFDKLKELEKTIVNPRHLIDFYNNYIQYCDMVDDKVEKEIYQEKLYNLSKDS